MQYIYTQIERESTRESRHPASNDAGRAASWNTSRRLRWMLKKFYELPMTRRLRRIFFARHLQPGFPRWFYVLRPVHEERHYMVTTSPQTCSVLQSSTILRNKVKLSAELRFPSMSQGSPSHCMVMEWCKVDLKHSRFASASRRK